MSDKPRFRKTAFTCVVILTALATHGLALDPKQPTTTYLRNDFTGENGLPDNVVNAIVQSRNGLLWVGTAGGLARFDGEHFSQIHFRAGVLHESPVRALAVAPNDDLWVGTEGGLEHIPSVTLNHFDPSLATMFHPGLGISDEITCLHFSRDGVLWVGSSGGLYRLDGERFVPVIPRESISRIAEAANGHLLIVTGEGFVEWDGTRIVSNPGLAARLGVRTDEIYDVFQDHSGAMWFCTGSGVARQSGGSVVRLDPYGGPHPVAAYRTYQDQQGNIWAYLASGLFRVSAMGMEPLAPGLHARSIYADRDGNLWVGSNGDGLVRFKDRAIRMFMTADGLPSKIPMTVLASHDGTLWVGNNCGGLSWFNGRRFQTYDEKNGMANSCVWALAEDGNHDLWIGTWGGGLLRFRDGRFTQYSEPQGLPSMVVRCILAARDGSLWIATPDGLSHMQNGRFRNYTTAQGLSSNRVITVYQDHRGGVWAGTSAGIDRLAGERFVPIPSAQALFNVPYSSLLEDAFGDLYAVSLSEGISRIEGNRVVSVNESLRPSQMVESKDQDLWLSGGGGIFRVAVADLRQSELGPDSPLDYASYGHADGLNSPECSVGAPNMAITPDGKLWVATINGLAMLDLPRLPHTHRQPATFVEEVLVGRKKQLAGRELVLPPGLHHVELHFNAVDLTSPEKIRLQYRLEGVDPEWLDADSTHTAIYTSIPVGAHSFHLRACGSDGVWDRVGIVYSVTQQPYFYQTTWFRVAALAGLGLLLAGVYFLRLRQMARQLQSRFEERLDERERIARELHDTLLQSVQGLILRFQAVAERIPESEPARQMMEKALDRADQVIVEGRDRVKGLRTPGEAASDLPQALAQAGQEFAQDSGVEFSVVVEGNPKGLHPDVRDEAYWIGREALVNAFQHAQGRRIEIEIGYGRRELRLRFRDDGRGIDPSVLEAGGRPGHWGIPGMRERARKIGANLQAWSRPGAGTEVELRVPGSRAYGNGGNRSPWRWLLSTVRGGTLTDGNHKQSD
jgi:signal transduction histidine kinase/ligand-binding sensor domain-containing protein